MSTQFTYDSSGGSTFVVDFTDDLVTITERRYFEGLLSVNRPLYRGTRSETYALLVGCYHAPHDVISENATTLAGFFHELSLDLESLGNKAKVLAESGLGTGRQVNDGGIVTLASSLELLGDYCLKGSAALDNHQPEHLLSIMESGSLLPTMLCDVALQLQNAIIRLN